MTVPVWTRPAGPWTRSGSYCDPQGHPVSIESLTPGWTVTLDRETSTWTLSGDVQPGPNYVLVEAVDEPGEFTTSESRRYTVCVWGLEANTSPVLK